MQAYLLPHGDRRTPWLWLACLPLILALCGPALRQQGQSVASPALDIWLLDLSDSMLARDLTPDRATRVRLLLQEMLADSAEHPVALILFAADAYLAMPPSRDHRAIALLLPDLRPAIMPIQGSAPERAVALALGQIPAGQSARLLLVTDGLSTAQMAQIAALWPCQRALFCRESARPRLDILLAAAPDKGGEAIELPPAARGAGLRLGRLLPPPDAIAMAQLAARLGGSLQWLEAGAPRFAPLPISQTQIQGQPRDLGPWLLIPLLPLALLARIGSTWLLLLGLGVGLLNPPPLQANPALSPAPSAQDGEAWQAYRRGDYQAAARAFQDPIWRGNAWYRVGDYARAAAAYAEANDATAHYNRGNALAWLGDLAAAEQAYLAALALEPRHEDALYNLALLRDRPPQASASPQAPRPDATPTPSAAPERPRPPAPPVVLLEQRLRKEAQRRPLIEVEEPW